MQINFYKCADDKRVINKTLTNIKTFTNCEIEDVTSIINPTITISLDNALYSYNYVYIPYFGRYYYIDDITALDGQRLLIKCSIDVLKTYASGILNCDIISRRNENNSDKYLPDDRPIESRYIRYSKKFNKSFDDFTSSYILITVGNGAINLT